MSKKVKPKIGEYVHTSWGLVLIVSEKELLEHDELYGKYNNFICWKYIKDTTQNKKANGEYYRYDSIGNYIEFKKSTLLEVILGWNSL